MSYDDRPSWDEYFMKLATEVARTTCLRRAVGGHRQGPPHPRNDNGFRRTESDRPPLRWWMPASRARRSERAAPRDMPWRPHAEQNAIIQAARYGINITGASIYHHAALRGVREDAHQRRYRGDRVPNPYPDELAMSMIEESGIKVRIFEG